MGKEGQHPTKPVSPANMTIFPPHHACDLVVSRLLSRVGCSDRWSRCQVLCSDVQFQIVCGPLASRNSHSSPRMFAKPPLNAPHKCAHLCPICVKLHFHCPYAYRVGRIAHLLAKQDTIHNPTIGCNSPCGSDSSKFVDCSTAASSTKRSLHRSLSPGYQKSIDWSR